MCAPTQEQIKNITSDLACEGAAQADARRVQGAAMAATIWEDRSAAPPQRRLKAQFLTMPE
jgi:hypothetical protein